MPKQIPTAIVYAASYVPLLDAVHRWLEEPTEVFEPESDIEMLVLKLAIEAGYGAGDITTVEAFRQRRQENLEKLRERRAEAARNSQVGVAAGQAVDRVAAVQEAAQRVERVALDVNNYIS